MEPIRQQQSSTGDGDLAIQKAFRFGFLILRLIMVFIFLAWLGTGVYKVEKGEEAVEFFLGKIRERGGERVMKEGLYWTLPFPFSRVIKIKTQQEYSITMLAAGDHIMFDPEQNTKNDPIVSNGRLYQVTSDMNIIHTGWKLSYKIHDLEAFVKNVYEEGDANDGNVKKFRWVKNVESIIKGVSFSSIVSESRKMTASELLTAKEAYHKLVLSRSKHELERLGSGIEITRLDFAVASPPNSLIFHFRKFNEAKQLKEQEITKSRQIAEKVQSETISEANRLSLAAETEVLRLKNDMKSRMVKFQSLQELFSKTPGLRVGFLKELYLDTVTRVISKANVEFISDEERITLKTTAFEPEETKEEGARNNE